MTLLIGTLTTGFILALLALGVLVSFRIFEFPDITTEGSITLGAACAATMLVAGASPIVACAGAFLAGAAAGAVTGTLFSKFKLNPLLSGIITMTALYSVNLRIMGKSNLPLLNETTLVTWAEHAGAFIFGAKPVLILGWAVTVRDLSTLIFSAILIAFVAALLFLFFQTSLGTSMRATGDNNQMIRALGVDDGNMVILGLALSNGLIALAGALLAQYQGFADVQMGIGMVVLGLASVIIGESLVGTRQLGYLLTGAVMGSILFRLLVSIALRWGLNPNDLKLITAAFVFLALVLPKWMGALKGKKKSAKTLEEKPKAGAAHA
jgi:putative ABC transport system permease protein